MLEKVVKTEEFCLRKDFIYMQKGNQTLPLGHDGLFIPIEEHDLMSIIAYSLSSEDYYEEVLKSMPNPNDTDKIESELLSAYEKHFQHNFTTMDDEIYEKYLHKDNATQLFGHHITFNVHSFFPRQFHLIRSRMHTSHLEFLMGISCSDSRKERLGKSKATFTKSISNMYILKTVDEKEFNMFKELAPSYFRHFCNSELHSMPSLMIRTLGCYRVYTKNHTLGKQACKWVMLFENLGCSMPAEVVVYDLKGSFNHRRLVNGKEKMTKMDRNFLEDFGGLPITISKEAKKILDVSIWNDTLFLSKYQVVDYSLLLIVSTTYKVVTMAIIDYIAKYTFEKALEHNYKKVVSADNPTITRPTLYKNRFRESVSNTFFLELDE
jgi:1-phosphatidylinositol-3-phosphate 5-kinase